MAEEEFRAEYLHRFRQQVEFPKAERQAELLSELERADAEQATVGEEQQVGAWASWRAVLGRSLIALGRSLAASEE